MKKLRTTLFVCLTALAVLTAFGCKQESDYSDPPKDWKYQTTLNDASSEGTIQVVIDDGGPVNWAVVVDEYNRVVKSKPDNIVDENNLAKVAIAAQGKAIQFTGLDTGKKYTIYVYQPGAEVKVGDKKDTAEALKRDLRGTVELKAKKGVSVKISNYAQNVPQAGLVTIVNSEQASGSGSTWPGNYGVKSVKAVKQEGDKWVEVSGYTVTATGANEYLITDAKDTRNNSKEFLFPAGEYYIAVNQPDRLDGADKQQIINHIQAFIDGANKDSPFPGLDKNLPARDEKNIAAYEKYQEEAYWVSYNSDPVKNKIQKIEAHESKATLDTSNLGGYLNGDKVAADNGRYAAPAVYEIVEAPAGER